MFLITALHLVTPKDIVIISEKITIASSCVSMFPFSAAFTSSGLLERRKRHNSINTKLPEPWKFTAAKIMKRVILQNIRMSMARRFGIVKENGVNEL